jgi:RNA polymerase sigma-70 factor (ECF subfamily)
MGGNGDGFASRLRAARQDHAADLLEAYRNYLRFLAWDGIGERFRAKIDPSDLVQETLIGANRNFAQFRGSSERELLAWLRTILARKLVDFVRRFRPGRDGKPLAERGFADVFEESSAALERLLPADDTRPSEAAQRREISVLLADALARMEPDHREVIVLRNLHELSWEEVARRMKRSNGAARQLWLRALQKIRPLMENIQ